MRVLCIDTSGPTCSVAIMQEEALLYEATVLNKRTHSVNLMPMVDEAISKSGCELSSIDIFAAVVGPGSFTGIRIGVSAVKGLSFGANKLCIGVNALEALAYGVMPSNKIICPLRDARNKQVYAAAFQNGEQVIEQQAIALSDFLHRLNAFNGDCLFVGDGALINKQEIIGELKEKAFFAPPQLNILRASSAASIALKNKENAHDPKQLTPLYLRLPQAERMRLEKNK